MKLSTSKQSGFTLVEIAIVLVIIGILLAGVLKGQSLINNSRIKGLVGNLNGVSAAYNGYLDRYKAPPGSEQPATITARGWVIGTGAPGTALSALTLPPANTFTGITATQQVFWQTLGAAGFFTAAPLSTTNPVSANGGLIGVSFGPYALQGIGACLSGLTPILAEGVDVVVDGQLATTNVGNNVGILRGTAGATPPTNPGAGVPGAVAYNEATATFWTVCESL